MTNLSRRAALRIFPALGAVVAAPAVAVAAAKPDGLSPAMSSAIAAFHDAKAESERHAEICDDMAATGLYPLFPEWTLPKTADGPWGPPVKLYSHPSEAHEYFDAKIAEYEKALEAWKDAEWEEGDPGIRQWRRRIETANRDRAAAVQSLTEQCEARAPLTEAERIADEVDEAWIATFHALLAVPCLSFEDVKAKTAVVSNAALAFEREERETFFRSILSEEA